MPGSRNKVDRFEMKRRPSDVNVQKWQEWSKVLPGFDVLTFQFVPLKTSTRLPLAADVPAETWDTEYLGVCLTWPPTTILINMQQKAPSVQLFSAHLLPLRNSVSRKRIPSLAPAFSFFNLSSPSITNKKQV